MRTLSSLAIATALTLGSASLALAQTAQYDDTESKVLSYGPKAGLFVPSSVAPKGAIKPGPINAHDQTMDGYLSYGAQTPEPILGGAE